MQRYNVVPALPNLKTPEPPTGRPFRPRLPVIFILALTLLACTFFGTGSRSASTVIIHHRLPTLTRTPLPSLTPTPNQTFQVTAPDTTSNNSAPLTLSTSPAAAGQSENPIALQADAPVIPPAQPAAATSAPAVNSPAPLQDLAALPSPPATVTLTPVPATSTPAPTPTATHTPAPTPTATPGTTGWAFANVRLSQDPQAGHLLLYGDMINNTGTSQLVNFLTGTFYDGQGQIIANEENTFDYWPIELVPSSGRIPFELAVAGIQNAANFDLRVQSQSSSQAPRQDFTFLEVNQWQAEDSYCLEGELQNPGGELQHYINVVAILYDSQNNVVNFSDTFGATPQGIVNEQTLGFEVCAEPPNQNVARYELRAWGE